MKNPFYEKEYLIKVGFKETSFGGDPVESGSWYHTDRHYSYIYTFAYAKEIDADKLWSEQFKTFKVSKELYETLTIAYLPIVEYSSGSTFGCSYGNQEVLGVFATHPEAEAYLKNTLNSCGAQPWTGYFDSLTDTKIISLHVAR